MREQQMRDVGCGLLMVAIGVGLLEFCSGCGNEAHSSDHRTIHTPSGTPVEVPWWLDPEKREAPYRAAAEELLGDALQEVEWAEVPSGWTVRIGLPAWPVRVRVDPREGLPVSRYVGLARGLTDHGSQRITVGIRCQEEMGPALPALLYEVRQARR